jgi:hypothetical protein
LSTDQKYLYEICEAVSTEDCPKNLEARNPGQIDHARWLTTANRILRLYICTRDPIQPLQTLAEFIMRVYALMWFRIKRICSAAYMCLKLSDYHYLRYLPESRGSQAHR